MNSPNKFILIIIVFFLVNPLPAQTELDAEINRLKNRTLLDVHTHYYSPKRRNKEFSETDYINQIITQKSFLISPSYQVLGESVKDDPRFKRYLEEKPELFDNSLIIERDQRTIQFIKNYRDHCCPVRRIV